MVVMCKCQLPTCMVGHLAIAPPPGRPSQHLVLHVIPRHHGPPPTASEERCLPVVEGHLAMGVATVASEIVTAPAIRDRLFLAARYVGSRHHAAAAALLVRPAAGHHAWSAADAQTHGVATEEVVEHRVVHVLP